MEIFLVNQYHPASTGLIEKLCDIKDKQFIPLTDEEMNLYDSSDFQHVFFGEQKQIFSEVEAGKSYVFVCDESVNIDDVINGADRFGIKIAIIRKYESYQGLKKANA